MTWWRTSTTILLTLWLLPLTMLAQDAREEGFIPLIGIPGLDGGGYNINNYLNILYVLAISVAAFLAVLRLVLAGFKYMFTDVVPQKDQAKRDIRGALVGLLVVLGAVLILNTINPQLTNLNALNLDEVSAPIFQYVETIPSPGSRRQGAAEEAQCAADGNTFIRFGGRNQDFVCCRSAADHPRCANAIQAAGNTPTETTRRFTSEAEASAFATACGGTYESPRARVYIAVCPIP
jgi:hypothetical protein